MNTMNKKTSSFRKRNLRKPIVGTCTSPQTGQVITSSGNGSLDAILGGGLALSSLCLIEEDRFGTHAKVLAKYFLAESGLSGHHMFYASLDHLPSDILAKLPSFVMKPGQSAPESLQQKNEMISQEMAGVPANAADNQMEEEQGSATRNDEFKDDIQMPKNGLRIAWRYNDLPFINSEQNTIEIGHDFDLSIPTSVGLCERIETWSLAPEWFNTKDTEIECLISNNTAANRREKMTDMPVQLTNPKLNDLLQNIQAVLKDYHGQFSMKSPMRLCITSLGSPLWHCENIAQQLLKFLTILRGIVRMATAVCFITMPMHLIAKYDPTLVTRIRNLVDYSIELESFAGSERATNPAYKEYHGLLHLRKISAVKALRSFQPDVTDLAFKLRRKRFVIEKFHLPPELQEDETEDRRKSTEIMPTMGCSANLPGQAGPKNALEF